MTSSPVTAPAGESAAWRAATTVIDLLTLVPEPRHARGKRHQLPAILAVIVAAVVSGGRTTPTPALKHADPAKLDWRPTPRTHVLGRTHTYVRLSRS